MSVTIDIAFIKQFEAEVHEAYQRQGSMLRGMARTKNNIVGKSTTFQKIGKGMASKKARHGLVPISEKDHSSVECFLDDYYDGNWVDKLDELKTNIDERQALSNAGAYALGRRTDQLILDALGTATSKSVGNASTNLTRKLALEATEYLNDADVPDDGRRWCVLTSRQWSAMMEIPEFTNADYVGDQNPWLKKSNHRFWHGVTWVRHSGLAGKKTTNMNCFMWHESALGHAIGAEIATDISWHGDRWANFIGHAMSQGAVLIDDIGVCPIKVDDTTALT